MIYHKQKYYLIKQIQHIVAELQWTWKFDIQYGTKAEISTKLQVNGQWWQHSVDKTPASPSKSPQSASKVSRIIPNIRLEKVAVGPQSDPTRITAVVSNYLWIIFELLLNPMLGGNSIDQQSNEQELANHVDLSRGTDAPNFGVTPFYTRRRVAKLGLPCKIGQK